MRRSKQSRLCSFSRAPVLLLTLGAGIIAPAHAQQEPAAPNDVRTVSERYTEPKPLNIPLPEYPKSERRRDVDGMVSVQLMVDPKGKPYEAEIISTSGNTAFEQAALKAIEDWKFVPATLGGMPIDASTVIPIHFKLVGGRAVRKEFMTSFDQFTKALQGGDATLSHAALKKLEPHNWYESSLLGLASFAYARTWGTEQQQIEHLRTAIAGAKKPVYLPKAAFTQALVDLFPLEVKTQDYAAALSTWQTLSDQKVDSKTLARFKPLVARVEALRHESSPIVFSGAMPNGMWRHQLFRNKFRIRVNSGRVSQIKLYCEKKFVLFPFDPALEYTVSSNYGNCSMIAYGDAGTTLELIQ